MLQSRRRGLHPGQALAEAAAKQRQQQHASVFLGQHLTSPNRSTVKHGSKIVPIGGNREGRFIFTGIVMRRDGRYPNGKRMAAFLKLDDPNGGFNGPGHVVSLIHTTNPVLLACQFSLSFSNPSR